MHQPCSPTSYHARVSQHLQKEDTGSSAVVPIPTVHSRTLSKVLEYCNKHAAEAEEAPPANGEADADPAADGSAADKSLEEWDKVSSCDASGCTLCKPTCAGSLCSGMPGMPFAVCVCGTRAPKPADGHTLMPVQEFVAVDQAVLYEMILAANFLDIKAWRHP